MRLLLAAGAPVGGLARLSHGGTTVTPLMQAAFMSSLESVQLLLGAGASLIRRNERGRSVLMHAVLSPCPDAASVPRVVDALLTVGVDVDTRDLAGDTALHHLASKSYGQPWAAAVARLLLGSGADGRVKNAAGKTPAGCVPVGARGGELYRLLLAAVGV